LARTNFKYEKRQKELAKQQKAEEKRLRKLERRNQSDDEGTSNAPDEENPTESSTGEATNLS
jgi:hypothetical protein